MKLGVIARADDRGLGNQTWEVVRHLSPERVLVVRSPGSERQGFPAHLDRFPGATVVEWTEGEWTLPRSVRDWLDGLDVVYSAETMYDDRVADWGREVGCATVVHANPEWFNLDNAPVPTAWWSATDWRLDRLPQGTRVVPMPVPTDRWPNPQPGTSVLHVAGKIAEGDRNGTQIVRDSRVECTITDQTTNPTGDYWRLYDGHGVLLMPRRYGGLCLPVIEAIGAGLVPVMTDTSPNRCWPIVPVPAEQTGRVSTRSGRVPLISCAPDVLARTVDRTLRKLPLHQERVAEWREANSWDALAERWHDELERVVKRRPPKLHRNTVSVVVPYSGDGRAEQWEWVRKHYETAHPDWEIVTGSHEGPWCKASAVADALSRAHGEILVIADADVVVDPDTLTEAVSVARHAAWVVPHRIVRRMSRQATADALRRPPGSVPARAPQLSRNAYEGVAGGGIVVVRRSIFERVGGFDSRFVGWGGEDAALGYALDTIAGRHVRLDADLWHLWHPPQPDHRQDGYRALADAYRDAYGSRRKMLALVSGMTVDEVTELSRPASFTSDNRSLCLYVDGQKVRFRDGKYQTVDPDIAGALRLHDSIREVVV